ncbi:hypothetical protein B0H19DRAFT_1055723 [Mycena capillaripes]|nr:hypothetical protein B0H19DRAFT_1055723 [Mycena capillaripes]
MSSIIMVKAIALIIFIAQFWLLLPQEPCKLRQIAQEQPVGDMSPQWTFSISNFWVQVEVVRDMWEASQGLFVRRAGPSETTLWRNVKGVKCGVIPAEENCSLIAGNAKSHKPEGSQWRDNP